MPSLTRTRRVHSCAYASLTPLAETHRTLHCCCLMLLPHPMAPLLPSTRVLRPQLLLCTACVWVRVCFQVKRWSSTTKISDENPSLNSDQPEEAEAAREAAEAEAARRAAVIKLQARARGRSARQSREETSAAKRAPNADTAAGEKDEAEEHDEASPPNDTGNAPKKPPLTRKDTRFRRERSEAVLANASKAQRNLSSGMKSGEDTRIRARNHEPAMSGLATWQ